MHLKELRRTRAESQRIAMKCANEYCQTQLSTSIEQTATTGSIGSCMKVLDRLLAQL